MHHSFLTRLWFCVGLLLFTAACSNAAPTDPELVGTWETTAVLDGRQWKFTYEITESEDYRFTSVTTDGNVWAQNGKWSVKSPRGFDDRGTYKFSGKDSVLITGKRGTATWKRVSTGDHTSGSKVEKELLGTWTTQAPIDGKEWTFTWVLKETGRYKLTGVTDDGSLIAHDGRWKSVSVSGKAEEGEYTFLNNGMAMSLTGPKGTGMWSRAGKTPYQEAVARANPKRKKPKHTVRPREIIPLCTASMDEKGQSGVDVESVAQALRGIDLSSHYMTDGWQPPPDDPQVSTWRAPRKKEYNLCGRVTLKLQGNQSRGYVYLLIHNRQADALERVEIVAEQGYDRSFTLDHLQYEKLGRYANKGPDGVTVMCADRKEQRVGTPHRVLCVGIHPISGVVMMLRGDFEQYDFNKTEAIRLMGALASSTKAAIVRALE